MTAVRRGSRDRRATQSIYKDAITEQEKRDSLSPKKNKSAEEEELETHDEDSSDSDKKSYVSENSSQPEDSDDDDNDDDDFLPAHAKKQSFGTRRLVTPQKKQTQSKKKIQVLLKSKSYTTHSTNESNFRRKKANRMKSSRKGVTSVLLSLSKKVLDEEENQENSLVAALLSSFRMDSPFQKSRRDLISTSSQPITIYTPRLEALASSIVSQHNEDPNCAQISLLNLLFRSVGGTLKTNIDPKSCHLEEMDNEDWGRVVTDLVDEMRHTPADCILLCADPNGAVHAAAVEENNRSTEGITVTQSSLGVREYRKIFEEFWYVLADIALSEGSMSSVQGNQEGSTVNSFDEDEGSLDDHRKSSNKRKQNANKTTLSKTHSQYDNAIRYDVELVRDLLARVTELVSVGQPDVRGAACIAALQMGHAVLDKTLLLESKLETATRQYEVAISRKTKKKQSEKAVTLRHHIDRLKRTKADLEEIVLGPIIEGVFIHRYRDSNMFIRATCLASLSRMSIQRPAILMVDKYLKYFGWMLSDKSECVRLASLNALLAPFQVYHGISTTKSNANVDISSLENVIGKFLPRIADCVIDVNLSVQEKAMEFLLMLLKDGFLDDVEDEAMWNQINLRALARDTYPRVRRDALYFIMEQLEAFDQIDEDSDQNEMLSKTNKQPSQTTSERVIVQRLDAIASWVAHILTDGSTPIEKIQIDLVDFLVISIRDMPAHKELVTNWSAMLKAIMDDSVATTSQGTSAGSSADVAKQRVLVEMLTCAVKLEVGSVKGSSFMSEDIDPEVLLFLENKEMSDAGRKNSKRTTHTSRYVGIQHENLSISLLKALPHMLLKFKSDPAILTSISILPRYLIPTVFSLPQRKNEFADLTKKLTEIYLQSNNEMVLKNIGLSLAHLSRGDHARAADAQLQTKKICTSLRDRIMELITSQTDKALRGLEKDGSVENVNSPVRRSTRQSSNVKSPVAGKNDKISSSEEKKFDSEYSLFLNLKRLRVLIKRIDITGFFDENKSDGLEIFFNSIANCVAHRLSACKIDQDEQVTTGDGKSSYRKINIEDDIDKNIHLCYANSIHEGLSFLLCATAWKLQSEQLINSLIVDNGEYEECKIDTEAEDEDEIDHIVVRFRDRIIGLVEVCFDLFLSSQSANDEGVVTTWQTAFYDFILECAGQISSDLRTLLPKEWSNAASPLLRAFSIKDDARLIGGFVHFFRSKEHKLRIVEGEESDPGLSREDIRAIFLPLGRSLVTNWKLGNRREAGIALAHVAGSVPEASTLVNSLSRLLKKVEPVRLLEAHMASLRQSYEHWMDNEPAEIENDRPTDEEMEAFEEAERNHESQFIAIEHQAAKFSMSLGVGKLRDPKLKPALLGFVREGVRFSFSNSDPEGDLELVLGSRLSFLSILCKYANWIKKDKRHREILKSDLMQRETELVNDPEFSDVHEDDITSLEKFRSALGLEASELLKSASSQLGTADGSSRDTRTFGSSERESRDNFTDLQSPLTQETRKQSKGSSSIGSMRSRGLSSVRSSLSPLYEEGKENESNSPPSVNSSSTRSLKRRSTDNSQDSTLYIGRSQSTFDGEVSNTDDESISQSYSSTKRSRLIK